MHYLINEPTTGMCYTNEAGGESLSQDYYNRDPIYVQWPCARDTDTTVYGHGSLQISWNHNYSAARNKIGFDRLGNPSTQWRRTPSCLSGGGGSWHPLTCN
jgi:hypothetical protein